jgi:hypothetical protein
VKQINANSEQKCSHQVSWLNGLVLAVSRSTLLWVSLYFIVLTVLMTWPLVLRMKSEVVGQIGDNIYFVWMIGWMKKALFELGVNPFDVWFLNYPQGWNMAYTEITPIMLLLALPFGFIGGATFAFNAAMMLTFILSGLGMFLWVQALTRNSAAALVGGTIYAFLPYHFAHFLIGHLNLSGIQWFPFYFWGLLEILQQQNKAVPVNAWWKPAVLAGVMLGLIGWTSQYYLYMTVLVTGWMVLVYLVFFARFRWREWGFWRQFVLMGLVALPLIVIAVMPYMMLFQQGGLPDRNISLVRMYSASPTDFLLPSTDHFLWGKWVGEHFNRQMWVEGTLYIGVVSFVLAVLAFLRRHQMGRSQMLALCAWGAGFAFVLAMGIDLHWNGQSVEIPLPTALSTLLGRTEAPIPLPGYVLFYVFPFFAKLRALMRFGVFVLLFFSVSAGLGAAWLLERRRADLRVVLTVVLLGLVFLDFYPGAYQEFARIQPRSLDYWLAQQPGQGAVIQFPFEKSEDQEHTYYTLTHGKPFVGGFFNAFPPEQYARLRPLMEHFPDERSVSLLSELGVQFVLVDKISYSDPQAIRQRCEALGLKFVMEMDGQMVFLRE